ncbi:hypothetical protein RCH09_002582 [Actimicrobium sp. GrIS 1.19]|uniref:polymorphic toxin-type HINT domain-containing protein n=1 Tax=Actimicrobium sp. GrIS 1.19 TaxID=3071708 RepID=UPI002E0BACD4|nr:hypothetical protein [Actimicrobium sp. GrIS 1.19]
MPVTFLRRTDAQRAVLIVMLILMTLTQSLSAWAQQSGVVWEICNPPPVCFATKAAKQAWAEANHCRFIEDVCEKNPASGDNKGASDADAGFWGSAWSQVKDGLVYGYKFVKGLLAGLKSQVADLFDLVTNLDEVVAGLIDLGKAFYNDPKGTLQKLGELLGQEAIDAITKATQCGPYDLGKVIGTYVSPATMLRLATRLTKYGGKLAEAVKATKLDLGCSSFAAGTPVQTPQGAVPIEQITTGDQVLSRHERSYADKAQPVTQTFGRIAPSYRELQTEFDTFKLTDEHPLWVQGKGWTLAKDVTDDDVIAGLRGDALVLRNTAVAQPLRVYNFSVASTENYFVGVGGVWAHNAKCDILTNRTPLWTSTKSQSSVQNAERHFKDHGADFGAKTPTDYILKAQEFLQNPPPGTLSKTRANGDILRFDPATDAFAIMDKSGAPRTFYKPDPAVHGYPTNLDYFNAQK